MPVKKISNPVAGAPILRKGGPHVKSKSGQRAEAKKGIKRVLNEWKNDNQQ